MPCNQYYGLGFFQEQGQTCEVILEEDQDHVEARNATYTDNNNALDWVSGFLKSFTDDGDELNNFFSCTVWNICDLGDKVNNPDVKNFLCAFDVIFLSETWLTSKQLGIKYLVLATRLFITLSDRNNTRVQNVVLVAKWFCTLLRRSLENKCDHFVVSFIGPSQVHSQLPLWTYAIHAS